MGSNSASSTQKEGAIATRSPIASIRVPQESPKLVSDCPLERHPPLLVCRTKLIRANVHFLSKPVPDGTTGTVVVLTTPDAQRTMLSYQVGNSTLPPRLTLVSR